MQLDDGMQSDGRVETYTRCVESLCGSAETFFTSVFAAQGKRQLSTYRNAEIKTLLADLLGQEEIQELGQKAAEIVRLLKAGLATQRQELAGLDAEDQRLDAVRRKLDGADDRVSAAERAKTAAQAALEAAQERHARVVVEREQSQATDARRAQLVAERQAALASATQALRALDAQEQAEQQRLERLDQRVASRLQQERQRRRALGQSRQRYLVVLAEASAVPHAGVPRAGSSADAVPGGGTSCRAARRRHRTGRGSGRAEGRGTGAPVRIDRRGALRRHGPAGALQAAG